MKVSYTFTLYLFKKTLPCPPYYYFIFCLLEECCSLCGKQKTAKRKIKLMLLLPDSEIMTDFFKLLSL